MATRKRRPRKLVTHDSTYIDPLHCDSKVSYKIIDAPTRLWGSVDLTDCQAKIEWYFGGDNTIAKLDRAIEMLNDFREKFIEAQAARKKRTPRRRRAAVKK